MADKTLESLVPPLDLCKKIPEGAFADSALVWCIMQDKVFGDKPKVIERTLADTQYFQRDSKFPAPTLDEILAALADFGKKATAGCIRDSQGRHVFSAGYYAGTYTRIDRTPATAALRLWFDVKGRG